MRSDENLEIQCACPMCQEVIILEMKPVSKENLDPENKMSMRGHYSFGGNYICTCGHAILTTLSVTAHELSKQ